MHTPRFSGQLINAGDFVLLRIPSRPIRTSCENVGTVSSLFWQIENCNPHLRAQFSTPLALARRQL
jgi:hypothetical protein